MSIQCDQQRFAYFGTPMVYSGSLRQNQPFRQHPDGVSGEHKIKVPESRGVDATGLTGVGYVEHSVFL